MSDISDIVESTLFELITQAVKTDCVNYLKETTCGMSMDMLTRNNGWITQLYDNIKNKYEDTLSSNAIYKIIFKEVLSAQFLEEANNGTLTKNEYIEHKINITKAMYMHKFMTEHFEAEFADLEKDIPREELEEVVSRYF